MADTLSLDNRLKTGFAVAIFLVVIVGIISIFTFRQQDEQASLVTHTYEIINQATTFQGILIDMETGRRGFRSTNDRKFLQSFYAGLSQIKPYIDGMQEMAVGNQRLSSEVQNLKVKTDTLINFWLSLGEDASHYTPAHISYIMNQEKQRMDEVRQVVSLILREQKKELEKREKETRRIVNRAMIELAISIALILVIVIALINQIIKEFKTRRKAEDTTRQKNEDLLLINRESSEQNWMLAGVAEINNALHGITDLKKLARNALDAIVNYIGINAGALYILNEEENKLQLLAGHALHTNARKEYRLYEGLVGQAAMEKEPVVIEDVKPEHILIEGGAIQATPSVAVYIPLMLDGSVKGVLELLQFKPFEEKDVKLLDMINNNIAVAIHSAEARGKIMQLFNQLKEQKIVLENQQEELRQVNEELSQQAEVLQASEEELRVQEEELRQINAELEEKNEMIETSRHALTLKAKELENISRYKSDFLANMSHELRTPLNSILILAKLLGDNAANNLTEKQVAHAKIIHKSGSDLLQLINDILDLSKIEAGKVEVHNEEVKISAITGNMQQLFGMIADEKKINFSIEKDTAIPESIITDKQKIEQVLINLLSNAFKFTPVDGRVDLAVKFSKQYAGYIDWVVSDTGIGIAADKQETIFEAFSQADSSTSRKYGGTGLGLSIITRLVKLLGGKISLHSQENKGSEFTISLPLHTASHAKVMDNLFHPETLPVQTVVPDDREDVAPGDEIMLIIEDDAVLAKIILDYAHSKNFKAIVALQGDEGLHYASHYIPSVIILDMKLPGMDGSTVLKKLKGDAATQHIPVHVISAVDDLKAAPGALSFLKKPFKTEDLERTFAAIGENLDSTTKRVLLISQDEKNIVKMEKLAGTGNLKVHFDKANTVKQASGKLLNKKYHTIIADLSGNFSQGAIALKWLHKQIQPQQLPTIILIDEDISEAKEMELKKIADVVVRKSVQSHKRLMDEMELFLSTVKDERQSTSFVSGTTSINEDLLHGKKVLLVDDDMRNVFALSAALEHEQMQVTVAGDGKEAIEILEHQHDIDIILMDVMMPEMDGYEATRIIRHKLKLNDLPVIALTAKAMADDREKCIEAGASDYISKPVDVQKLISLMRVWLA